MILTHKENCIFANSENHDGPPCSCHNQTVTYTYNMIYKISLPAPTLGSVIPQLEKIRKDFETTGARILSGEGVYTDEYGRKSVFSVD